MGDFRGAALATLVLWLGLSPLGARAAVELDESADAAPVAPPPSELGAGFAAWVIASGDNGGLPFAVVDKVAAEVSVYGADGALLGAGPALLGSAEGDESTPGVGDRELSDIAPDERTTPAGRFVASFGPAQGRRRVLWVDYGTAISIHQVVTARRSEHRLKRLLSPTAADNRITYGCINVSAGFYEEVVRPTFTGTSGVFYILPEARSVAEVFPAFRGQALALAPEPSAGELIVTSPDLAPAAEALPEEAAPFEIPASEVAVSDTPAADAPVLAVDDPVSDTLVSDTADVEAVALGAAAFETTVVDTAALDADDAEPADADADPEVPVPESPVPDIAAYTNFVPR